MANPNLLAKHNSELARAAAAAMQQNYQDTIEVCSELLTGCVYPEMEASGDAVSARRCRAEARLLMATAMHYTDSHHEDVLRVLNHALDSPPQVQKDVYFTMAVVQLSAEEPEAARASMEKCLEVIAALREVEASDTSFADQEKEAREFLAQIAQQKKPMVN